MVTYFGYSAPSVKISSFGFVIFITTRHIIWSICILNGIRYFRVAVFVDRFICKDCDAQLINIGNVIRLVYHGVECQTIAICHPSHHGLSDYTPDAFNILLDIWIFCIINSIFLFVLYPSLKYFSGIQINMWVINIDIHLPVFVLFRGDAHFSYCVCSILEIDKQTSIRILFLTLYKCIN